MLKHTLANGDIIFDVYLDQWGIVDSETIELEEDMSDCVIRYIPCEYDYEEDLWVEKLGCCETQAQDAYPLVAGKYFWGYDVCLEINKDCFDEDHDYDYYCPERQENCWEFEVA